MLKAYCSNICTVPSRLHRVEGIFLVLKLFEELLRQQPNCPTNKKNKFKKDSVTINWGLRIPNPKFQRLHKVGEIFLVLKLFEELLIGTTEYGTICKLRHLSYCSLVLLLTTWFHKFVSQIFLTKFYLLFIRGFQMAFFCKVISYISNFNTFLFKTRETIWV